MIVKALQRNAKTHAFDGEREGGREGGREEERKTTPLQFIIGYKVDWEDETTGTSVIHTLRYSPFNDVSMPLIISSVMSMSLLI